MVMPERKGACSALESADVIAPHRTASRKASSLLGSSNRPATGVGSVGVSSTRAPGSISQMAVSSSPSPSSSTEASSTRCCTASPASSSTWLLGPWASLTVKRSDPQMSHAR